MSQKINLVIPCAGLGKRFQDDNYKLPKPLIEIFGKPMIQLVVENINIDGHYIFIVQKEHYEKYNLQELLTKIAPGCDIVQANGLTEGAASTTLLAKDYINNETPLLIANSDQYIKWNSTDFLKSLDSDGCMLTFTDTDPKWSFIRLKDGFVCEVAEKIPISNIANVGVYYWSKGSDYVKYAEQMIVKNIRVNGEFYIAVVYNESIADGKKIKKYPVEAMYGLGIPSDFEKFITLASKDVEFFHK